mmetsp:Transcript_14228/g.21033  ORF Transcript_14228/g.21033 Transcript_14228/m.21033 type:complete len:473 (+) Transcript_14228:92-1510(+)
MMRKTRQLLATAEPLQCEEKEENDRKTENSARDKEKLPQGKSGTDCSDSIGRSGHILSRATLSSKITRKWQDSFWVHILPTTLVVFRSEENFRQWRAKERLSRKALITIDFDTLGTVSSTKNSLRTNQLPKVPATKLISRVHKYSLGDIKATLRGGEALFTFQVERLSGVGVDVIASFASTTPANLRVFRQVLRDCIQVATPGKIRSKGSKSRKKGHETENGEEDTHVSTIISTQVGSEMTRSTYQMTRDGSLSGSLSSAAASYRSGSMASRPKKKYYQLDPKLGVDFASHVESALTCSTDKVQSNYGDASIHTKRKPNVIQIKTSCKTKSRSSKLKNDESDKKSYSTDLKNIPPYVGSKITRHISNSNHDASLQDTEGSEHIPITSIYTAKAGETESYKLENDEDTQVHSHIVSQRTCDDNESQGEDEGNLYTVYADNAEDDEEDLVEIIIQSKMGTIQIDQLECEDNDKR